MTPPPPLKRLPILHFALKPNKKGASVLETLNYLRWAEHELLCAGIVF